jgi:hypothetical protein
MSLDQRLRDGLAEEVRDLATSSDDDLVARVMGAGRRRRHRRRITTGVGLALLVAVVLVAVPAVTDLLRSSGETRPAGPPGPYAEVAGTYVVTLSDVDPEVEANGLAGTWLLDLTADGVVVLAPPDTFEEGVSGIAFAVDDGRFRTNAFSNVSCNGYRAGTYRLELDGTSLTLIPLDDPCPLRAALFGSRTWDRL